MKKKPNETLMRERLASAPVFHPDPHQGLSGFEVESRQKTGLANTPTKSAGKSFFHIFFDNIVTVPSVVLFVICGFMIAAGVRTLNSYVFVLCLGVSIIISIVTDIKAKVVVEKLRIVTSNQVKVIRAGEEKVIPQEEIVYSDIVLLSAGDQIPVDGIVVEGGIITDESLLTGESIGVPKAVGDHVLSGSFVAAGQAYIEVTAVSSLCYAEGLKNAVVHFRRPQSELGSSTKKIFLVASIFASILGLAMFIIAYFKTKDRPTGFDYLDTVLSASGSIVAMIPSGLYLLFSITLTRGHIALSRRGIAVQELYSIETLARVDTICFDKTGTLTDGRLSVSSFLNHSDYSEEEIYRHVANLLAATKDKNPTALALLDAVGQGDEEAKSAIPFRSDFKYSAAELQDGTWIIGAPRFIKTDAKIDEKELAPYYEEGKRIIGLYHSHSPIENGEIHAISALIGYFILQDHLKDDAKETIDWFLQNEVAIKVISGDDPRTAASVAKAAGVPNADAFISLAGKSEEEVASLASQYTVFGRVTPTQKEALIKALQSAGHSVAMTGDGVNDILALRAADCSIAMASGSAAAKHAAHLISLNNEFSKLPDVVLEGRQVINNLQRASSLFLSKTVFAVLTTLFFLFSSIFIGRIYPYETGNLLIWEIVVIGGGGTFLAFEKSHNRLNGSFLKNVSVEAFPGGIAAAFVVLVLYAIHRIWPFYLSYIAFVSVSVLGFTILSIVTLIRICIPLSPYRIFVLCLAVVVGVGLAVWDVLGSDWHSKSMFLGIYYGAVREYHLLLMAGVVAAAAALYVLATHFFRKRKKEK